METEAGTPTKITTRSVNISRARSPPGIQKAHRSNSRTSPLGRDELFSSVPGRRPQLVEILHAIGPSEFSPMLPLLLYGSSATGKTRSVLQILRHLNRPFAYVSCRSCNTPRILFGSVLRQLAPGTSKRCCERASEFVDHLKTIASKMCGRMVYLVFDNVEFIRNWRSKGSGLLSLLFKIHDLVKTPSLGFIFISSATPETYYADFGPTEPFCILFPDYTEDELSKILIRNRDNPDLYSSFLKTVLSSFVRVSRRIDELSIVLDPLYRKYCEPLSDLSFAPDEATKRKLFVGLEPHIRCALNERELFVGLHEPHRRLAGRKEGSAAAGLDFHMSLSAKYLIISAFLASTNPANLDGALFDTTGGTANTKRKRKFSEASEQKKDHKAREQLMKGPGSFSLERWFAIYQCITSVADMGIVDEDVDDGPAKDRECGLMSDVLSQLSTLCNANFITRGGSCPLECSLRYRSTIDEDLAIKIARSIDFPLTKYLYRN